jgi:hypothetical protein
MGLTETRRLEHRAHGVHGDALVWNIEFTGLTERLVVWNTRLTEFTETLLF